MSGKPGRLRRSFSVAFKRQVVAEAFAPGASVAKVARRYDLNANQVFNWRRRYGVDGAFLPVVVTDCERPTTAPEPATATENSVGEVEITLATGHRVTLRGGFDGVQVARLLRGLCR